VSGVRWTTGLGIAVGGLGGALAALLGAAAGPASPPRVADARPAATTEAQSSAPTSSAVSSAPPVLPSAEANAAVVTASVVPPASSTAPPADAALTPPPLAPLTTREALIRAQVLCDQRKLYDECSRAAEALEKGTTGPVDAAQAKRFRRIALTHLVRECEVGDPHACFVMAAKYREGTELPSSAVRASTLEKRGVELCRFRSAPECPAP
jgi:hypothetical protein